MQQIPLPKVPLPSDERYHRVPPYTGIFFWLFLPIAAYCGFTSNWLLLLGTAFVSVIANSWMRQSRVLKLTARSQEALTFYNSGDLQRALDEYEFLLDEFRRAGDPGGHAACVCNLGLIHMRRGSLDTALSLFAMAIDTKAFESSSSGIREYAGTVLSGIARCYAIRGQLEEADKWQTLAHDNTGSAREGILLPVDLILEIRRGNDAVALANAVEHWRNAEANLPLFEIKVMRTLRAFACERMGNAAEAAQWLAGVAPIRAGDIDYIAAEWPNFRNFLERHQLTPANVPVTPQAQEASNALR